MNYRKLFSSTSGELYLPGLSLWQCIKIALYLMCSGKKKKWILLSINDYEKKRYINDVNYKLLTNEQRRILVEYCRLCVNNNEALVNAQDKTLLEAKNILSRVSI